jgi:hypothetical protein
MLTQGMLTEMPLLTVVAITTLFLLSSICGDDLLSQRLHYTNTKKV